MAQRSSRDILTVVKRIIAERKLPNGADVQDKFTVELANLFEPYLSAIHENEQTIRLMATEERDDDGGLLARNSFESGLAAVQRSPQTDKILPPSVQKLLSLAIKYQNISSLAETTQKLNALSECLDFFLRSPLIADKELLKSACGTLSRALNSEEIQQRWKQIERELDGAGLSFEERSKRFRLNTGGRGGVLRNRVIYLLSESLRQGFRQRTGVKEERPLELRAQVAIALSSTLESIYLDTTSAGVIYKAMRWPSYRKKSKQQRPREKI